MEIKQLQNHHISMVEEISKQQFSDGWTKEQIADGLKSENYICLGVFEQDVLCSYCLALNSIDDINILTIATRQEYKRQGMATLIVNLLSKMAKTENKTLSLEVKEGNVVARQFYQKMGFEKKYVRNKYYKDGSDAIIYFKFQ